MTREAEILEELEKLRKEVALGVTRLTGIELMARMIDKNLERIWKRLEEDRR